MLRCGRSGRKTTIVSDAVTRGQLEPLVEVLLHTGNEVPRWLEWMALPDRVAAK